MDGIGLRSSGAGHLMYPSGYRCPRRDKSSGPTEKLRRRNSRSSQTNLKEKRLSKALFKVLVVNRLVLRRKGIIVSPKDLSTALEEIFQDSAKYSL
jgi:hypothetical protein